MTNTCQYLNLTNKNLQNCFTSDMDLKPYGWGLGSFGLPGDFSPSSRFVKASYLSLNYICEKDEASSVTQLFHLSDSVSMVRGSIRMPTNSPSIPVVSTQTRESMITRHTTTTSLLPFT